MGLYVMFTKIWPYAFTDIIDQESVIFLNSDHK